MHPTDHAHPCYKDRRFDEGNPLAERNTLWAIILTVTMMIAEIVGGIVFGSMALLADGWHMSSHALALGLSLAAYMAARKLSESPQFTFGTWKIEILGGYTSALFLLVIAGLMLYHSVERLLNPHSIEYNQAIFVAALGLIVNLICAWLLKDDHHHHHHGHSHGHDHGHHHHDHHHHDHHHHEHDQHDQEHHDHGHHDLNLRAAYIHVLTDALTSLLAIFALIGGKFWGADWLDPVMGIVGSVLVTIWAVGLLRESGKVLLDAEMDGPLPDRVRRTIHVHAPEANVHDLHVWRLGRAHYACVLSVSGTDVSVATIKEWLSTVNGLEHVTVEIT